MAQCCPSASSNRPWPPGRTFTFVTQGMLDLSDGQHAHLRLHRQVPSGQRVMRPNRMPRVVQFPDQPAHARRIRSDITQLRAIHAKRSNVLGVEPENVAVLKIAGPTPPKEESLAAAGLTVLDWFPDRVVVASPGDPDLMGLLKRLDEYQTGPRPPGAGEDTYDVPDTDGERPEQAPRARTAPHQALFDRIEEIRPLGVDEILSPAAGAAIESAAPSDILTLDLQCWCPEDEDEARRRHSRTVDAIENGGGRVLDKTVRHRSGLSLIRVDVTAELALTLADLPDVRRVDRIPRPLISQVEATTWGADHLPQVLAPTPDAPLIAVIDSGVRAAHPLIAPAFVDALATDGLEAERDGKGHGTFVASLALHGSLEPILERPSEPITPAGRLLSVRVLDDDGQFPAADLWENDLMRALEAAANEGARIINLSVGDPRHPYTPSRPTALAATVDEFIRDRGVVVVISTGNMTTDSYDREQHDGDFTSRLLDYDDSGMLDPATSALALTVGALGSDYGQGLREARTLIDQEQFGRPDVPSPLTRTGPGAAKMIKPETAMPGGHLVHTHTDRYPRQAPSTNVLGANGTDPNRLLAHDAGTSYAAPLVTHVAATAMTANPTLSGRGIRALVLSSIEPLGHYLDLEGAAGAARERELSGYGRPHAERAAHSSDHRAVLISEEALPVNNVHLYVVPLPASFFTSGGRRRVTAALAFDPDTRPTRLDYLASRMQVHAYKGVTVEEVAAAYIAAEATPAAPSLASPDEAPDDAQSEGPAALHRFQLMLQPSATHRSRGAHVYGTWERSTILKPEDGKYLVVAVQSMNRWRSPEATDRYALSVVLERDVAHTAIYADLRAQLQLEVEVEQNAEIEPPVEIEV